jgi:hypothetical protein
MLPLRTIWNQPGVVAPHLSQIAYGRACTSTTPADGGRHSGMVWVVERNIPESWDLWRETQDDADRGGQVAREPSHQDLSGFHHRPRHNRWRAINQNRQGYHHLPYPHGVMTTLIQPSCLSQKVL